MFQDEHLIGALNECTFLFLLFTVLFFNEARISLADKFTSLQYFMTMSTTTTTKMRATMRVKQFNSRAGGKHLTNADVCNNGVLMYVGKSQSTKSNDYVPVSPRNRKCIIMDFIKNVQPSF